MPAPVPASHSASPAPATEPPYAAALRSADIDTRNDGVAAAVAAGAAAVPVLLALSREAGAARAPAMYALAELADPRARDTFVAGLSDANEAVRAQAARGLARIGDPQGIEACLNALNDDPDPLHNDQTPAVQALGALGLRAVPGLLERMGSDDALTRLRAQRAFELVLGRRHGFVPGQGFDTPAGEAAMRAEWQAQGDYDHGAPPARRTQAIAQWRQWLRSAKERP